MEKCLIYLICKWTQQLGERTSELQWTFAMTGIYAQGSWSRDGGLSSEIVYPSAYIQGPGPGLAQAPGGCGVQTPGPALHRPQSQA